MIEKEKYDKWKKLVNMSGSELKRFMDSDEGKVAGLSKSEADKQGIKSGRESAKWIIKMKSTKFENWTPEMHKWANRQISFISRMKGNKGPLFDDKKRKTRKHLSLLIWGHNPIKKSSVNENALKQDILLNLIEENEIKLFNPTFFKRFSTSIISIFAGFGVMTLSYSSLKEIANYFNPVTVNYSFDATTNTQHWSTGGYEQYWLILWFIATGIGAVTTYSIAKFFKNKLSTLHSLDELEIQLKEINSNLKLLQGDSKAFKDLITSRNVILKGMKLTYNKLEKNDDQSSSEFKDKLKKILIDNV